MTVYELIQELVQHDAILEVRVKSKVGGFNYDCSNCETTLDIEEDIYDMSIDEIDRNGKIIEIRCEE